MAINKTVGKINALGLSREDYKGNKSTLCPGCGHDSISNQIISVAYEAGLKQENVIKLSGIGCSSKTPAYFLGRSHAFNAIHGRMPSIATGATTVNHELVAVGVSGDGDTGSIGFGQFKHMTRRNVPMVYIIENNGVYGLTKGQFSATADAGQELKYYGRNEYPAIDLCMEAIVGGATFVARSFSGHAEQVRTLLKAALTHRGTAVIDIISPCVTFNNNPGSSKSYEYGKAHEVPLHDIELIPEGFVPEREEISLDDEKMEVYESGKEILVRMHDGTFLRLQKVGPDHDPRNKLQALNLLEKAGMEQLFITGLLYYEEPRPTLVDTLHLVDTPLTALQGDALRPSREALDKLMQDMM